MQKLPERAANQYTSKIKKCIVINRLFLFTQDDLTDVTLKTHQHKTKRITVYGGH